MSLTINYKGKDVEIPAGSHEDRIIFVGADHRGFEYKQQIIKAFEKMYKIRDIGTNSSERCDYPAISDELGRSISEDWLNRAGIGICGSGIGIKELATKHWRVYGAQCLNPQMAETSRKHNNSNFLGIGADYVDLITAIDTVRAWLDTPFYTDPVKEEAYLKRFLQKMELEDAIIRANFNEF